jgi:hypothetical protein
MLAYTVSEQGFPDNTDIQECFYSHAAEDVEQLTALSEPVDVKYSDTAVERP